MNKIAALEAERMIDARGGPPVEPAVVVVEGERITAAGSPAQIKVPEGAKRIVLGARTLLPGLIDAHVHLKGWRSANPNDILITPHPLAAREIPGPRILTAYRGLSQTGRVETVTWAADIRPLRQEVDGVGDCRRVVREQIGRGADLIKVSITGRVYAPQSDPGQTAYTLEEIRAVVDEAHRMGRLVATYAQATQGIKNGILAGVDSIEHGIYLDEEACELMRERNTALVPTLAYFHRIATLGESHGSPAYAVRKAREVVDAHMKSFALALRMKLRIGMGTDFEGSPLFPHGENGMELELMVQGGMPAGDVIVAATATNAAIFGIEKKVGTIATGKIADLIAVPGNPLKEISLLRRVEFVMQGGRVACSRIPDVAEIS